MSVVHSLTAEELRVLACLVEKSFTTPDQYPLSTNALVAACNQKTSRDPVVDYSAQLVDHTLQLLRDAGWVRMLRTSGSRAFKHRHVVDEKLGLSTPELSVMAVLALRGAQSPGELKTRTERYHQFEDLQFEDLDAVERVLQSLAGGDPALTRNVGREPGQSQDRWVQLIGLESGGSVAIDSAPAASTVGSRGPEQPITAVPVPDGAPSAEGSLVERVEQLERRLALLERELGLDGPEVT